MSLPGDDALVDAMAVSGCIWVAAQRARFHPKGRALLQPERAVLGSFFSDSTLQSVRIAVVPRIENPPFYAAFPPEIRAGLIDFTQMEGITFSDVFLVRLDVAQSGTAWLALVFHEIVHVVQYDQLGVAGFVDAYLRGWAANGYDYLQIPLEAMAYDLQARFQRGGGPFAAEKEIRNRLANERGAAGS